MTTHKVNTVVIGAGPGGYVCGIKLGQLGIDTLVIEKEYMGGVCLNVGCIPSKALIQAGKTLETGKKASTMGIHFEDPTLNMEELQRWKSGIVNRLTSGVGTLLKANGVAALSGTARFTSDRTLAVTLADGSEDTVEFEQAVIATGSTPADLPGFPVDGDVVWGSTEALAMDEVHDRVVVIGGGYIGMELGQMIRKLGTEVTIVEYTPSVLPGFDKDAIRVINRKLKKSGVTVHTGAAAKSWSRDGDDVVVHFEKKGEQQEARCDRILVTIGRRSNTSGLELERAGLAADDRGFLTVDDQCRTKVPNIFAIGDVAGQPMLAHKASREGEIVAEVISGKNSARIYKTVPAVVFTDPEIATAGMSEAEAKEKGFEVKVGKFPWGANGRALSAGETDGFVKVITDAADGQILGVLIIGPHATDLISEAALAVEMDAFAEDLALTIHPHPTLGEAMMEAAAHALGHAVHIVN